MKLLEPLSGVKTGQGHAMIHLVFFIAMFFIPDTGDICKTVDYEFNHKSIKEYIFNRDGEKFKDSEQWELK